MQITIKLPQELKDIKLKDYIKYSEIDFTDKSEEFLRIKILDIFYGITYDKYKKLKSYDVNLMVGNITTLLATKDCELVRNFKLNGLEFGFIPSLDDITFGELVDLESSKNINDTLAILYRPITNKKRDKYTIEDYVAYTKYSNMFLELPMDIVYSALFFFVHLNRDCIESIKKSIMEKDSEVKKKKNLRKNGVGFRRLLRVRETT